MSNTITPPLFDLTDPENPTVYCSFCGISQHEVRTIIAGSTVFICNECVELCEEINWERSNDGRIRFKFEIEASEILNKQYYYDAMVELIAEKFPDKDIKFEFLHAQKTPNSKSANFLSISYYNKNKDNKAAADKSSDKDARIKIQDDMKNIALELAVLTKKYLFESERNKRIEKEMKLLREEYLEVLRSKSGIGKTEKTELKVVLFLDIAGFSKMESEEKVAIVDMLRGIIPPLMSNIGANQINMWGDAIVATFENPSHAIACAIKFIRHLMVEQLDARIGMAWGEIRTAYNPATDKMDIDGKTVDFAARLEPMAQIGGILLSEDFGALDIDKEIARLIPVERKVKKDFDQYKAGDKIKLFEIEILRN